MPKNSLNQYAENDLLDLLRSGSHAAFTEIYERYWDKLYVTAYSRLLNELEAEEIVQNIFLSLWRRKESLELTYSLATYLSVSVKYQILTRIAQHKRDKERSLQLKLSTVEGEETTNEWLTEKELRAQIALCVNSLPEKCRIVFQLSREHYLSNRQIAEELNISEKTVEGHITKALSILRTSLNISLPILISILENKIHN